MELFTPHFFLASIFNNINVKVAFFLSHLFLKSLPVSSVRFQENRSLVLASAVACEVYVSGFPMASMELRCQLCTG